MSAEAVLLSGSKAGKDRLTRMVASSSQFLMGWTEEAPRSLLCGPLHMEAYYTSGDMGGEPERDRERARDREKEPVR